MGILDDAIREHLDLKRSRGADPSEVTRQEQEALGPVRREPVAEPDAAAESAPAPEDVVAAESAVEPEEPVVEVPFGHDPDLAPASAPAEPAAEAPPAPPAAPPRAAAEPVAPAAEDTQEWGFDEVEEAAPPAPSPAEEDVLEETPEFLQETPEHDRLWFEQKPPRDFDFDS